MNRKYHVVAFVGGAGINVAKTFLKLKEQLCKSESPSVKTLVIGDWTCSANSSTLPTSDYQFMLSAEFTRSRVPHLKNVIEQQLSLAKAEINYLRQDMQEHYASLTVVSGLGGQTGTFAGGAIAEMAHEEGIPTCKILITPCEFEGGRVSLAENFISKTNSDFYRQIELSNADAWIESSEGTSMLEVFNVVNQRASEAVLNSLILFTAFR
jgi:cell division GTPase FtsZ